MKVNSVTITINLKSDVVSMSENAGDAEVIVTLGKRTRITASEMWDNKETTNGADGG